MKHTPVCLLILDGWGCAPAGYPAKDSAVAMARTPNVDRLLREYPSTTLACSGAAVGLPDGVIGNSEVGHITIGAGRRVLQDMSLIDAAIERGEIAENPVLAELVRAAESHGGALHLLGLLSDAGVHSHTRHLYALIRAASALFSGEIVVHAFTDGRDSPPGMALGLIRELKRFLAAYPKARIGSVIGRFYAMDRDKRFDRTERAYRALVFGEGEPAASAEEATGQAAAAGETDEFIAPRLIAGPDDRYRPISAGDAALFFNYRADRARQMTQALTGIDFTGFDRGGFDRPALYATMTRYEASWDLPALFPPKRVEASLGEVISGAGLAQLRLAETEKYAHVTYFLNCGREEPLPGEERVLIPSPREVATYDLKPEMSAYGVRDAFLEKWATGRHALTVVNLANADMVGHTGSLAAATRACEVVDACVGAMSAAVLASGGRLIVTADHGNAEEMKTPDGRPMTAHTLNRVPCILVSETHRGARARQGELADLAPTLLHLAGLDKPEQMTGSRLID